MKGWIYILKRARENTLKIGKTSRTPEERADELSRATGVSSPYVVVHAREVKDMDNCEIKVHKELSEYRYNKEFFDIDVKTAINIVDEICDSDTLFISKDEFNKSRSYFDVIYWKQTQKLSDFEKLGPEPIISEHLEIFDPSCVDECLNRIEENEYLIGSCDFIPFLKKKDFNKNGLSKNLLIHKNILSGYYGQVFYPMLSDLYPEIKSESFKKFEEKMDKSFNILFNELIQKNYKIVYIQFTRDEHLYRN